MLQCFRLAKYELIEKIDSVGMITFESTLKFKEYY
jgi:hypothetical protein